MFDFLEIEDVLDLHEESPKRYGEATGLREPDLLDSTIAAALNTFLYADGDEFDVAAP